MKRRLLITAFLLLALALALVLFVPRSQKPQPAMNIRIAAVTTKNSSGRVAVTWCTAVPRARDQRPAVLAWSVCIEETNKASVRHSTISLSPSEVDLMSTSHHGPDEDGIMQWGEGQRLDPEKVYRAIGSYREPNRFDGLI